MDSYDFRSELERFSDAELLAELARRRYVSVDPPLKDDSGLTIKKLAEMYKAKDKNLRKCVRIYADEVRQTEETIMEKLERMTGIYRLERRAYPSADPCGIFGD